MNQMLVCPNCGKEISPDQKVCEYCGINIEKHTVKEIKENHKKAKRKVLILCATVLVIIYTIINIVGFFVVKDILMKKQSDAKTKIYLDKYIDIAYSHYDENGITLKYEFDEKRLTNKFTYSFSDEEEYNPEEEAKYPNNPTEATQKLIEGTTVEIVNNGSLHNGDVFEVIITFESEYSGFKKEIYDGTVTYEISGLEIIKREWLKDNE